MSDSKIWNANTSPYLYNLPTVRRMRAGVIRRSKANAQRIAKERAEAQGLVRDVIGDALADYQPYLDALAEQAKERGAL